jgi:hypothetical protein
MDCARSERLPACGIEAAMSQTLCLNGAQDSMPEIGEFPQQLLRRQGEPGRMSVTVEGLEKALIECYEKNLLPSEIGAAWGKKGKVVDLSRYDNFPGG